MGRTGQNKSLFFILFLFVGSYAVFSVSAIAKNSSKYGIADWIIVLGMLAFLLFIEFILFKKFTGKSTGNSTKYINPYVDITKYRDDGNNIGRFPRVNYDNVFLQEGEWIIYAVPAKSYTEKEQVVGYTGGSAGVSVRVAKGVSVRSGSSKGRAIRQNVAKFNAGDYVVTNRRIIFVSPNDGFEYNIEKISVLKIVAKNAFMIASGNKHKNICVEENQLAVAVSTTRLMVDESTKYVNGMPMPPYLADEGLQEPVEYGSNPPNTQQIMEAMRNMNEALNGLEDSVTKIEQLKKEKEN